MRSPQPSTVVIACPHCGTRYQVLPETLGPRGRKVSCAHCGRAWMAEAQPAPTEDRLFTPNEEEALDREFTALEQRDAFAEVAGKFDMLTGDEPPPPEVVKSIAEIKAALAPKVATVPTADAPNQEHKPTKAEKVARGKLEKRQRAVAKALPARRLLRLVRIGSVLLLAGLLAGGYAFRTEIVRLAPDMAGVYSALGLSVNVVGLEFSDVTTLMTRRGENAVITVTAKIHGISARRVVVPPVVVTLLDAHGTALYQWSVTPSTGDVEPGEAIEFTAELASPPEGATQLRLGFASGGPRPEAVAAAEPAEHDPMPNVTTKETQH